MRPRAGTSPVKNPRLLMAPVRALSNRWGRRATTVAAYLSWNSARVGQNARPGWLQECPAAGERGRFEHDSVALSTNAAKRRSRASSPRPSTSRQCPSQSPSRTTARSSPSRRARRPARTAPIVDGSSQHSAAYAAVRPSPWRRPRTAGARGPRRPARRPRRRAPPPREERRDPGRRAAGRRRRRDAPLERRAPAWDAGDDARDEKRDDVGDEPGEKWGGGLGAPPLSGEWGDVGGVPTRRSLVVVRERGRRLRRELAPLRLADPLGDLASVSSNPNQCSKSSRSAGARAARPGDATAVRRRRRGRGGRHRQGGGAVQAC